MLGQINVQKPPRLADLGARHQPGLGAGLQRVRVKAEEFGGFGKVERAHGSAGRSRRWQHGNLTAHCVRRPCLDAFDDVLQQHAFGRVLGFDRD